MANQLDELNPEIREEGLDTNVIVKKIVAAKNGYTTRNPFVASQEIKEQAKGVFF